MPIVGVQFVTGMEFHEPLGRNAPYAVPADHSMAGQLLADVRHTADIQTCCVESIGVNVKPTPGFVAEDEVAFPAVVARLLAKASRTEYVSKARHLIVRQRDIQVSVRSRLLFQNCINRPAAIDVHFEAILFQERDQIDGIFLGHSVQCSSRVEALD